MPSSNSAVFAAVCLDHRGDQVGAALESAMASPSIA